VEHGTYGTKQKTKNETRKKTTINRTTTKGTTFFYVYYDSTVFMIFVELLIYHYGLRRG
jgi:hypothetical protein